MSIYMTMLLLAGLGVVIAGLLYTLGIGRRQKKSNGNLDAQMPETVQEHAYIRNPIFLTYIIVLTIALLFVVYFAVTTGRY